VTLLAQHIAAVLIDHVRRDNQGKLSVFAGEIPSLLFSRYEIECPHELAEEALAVLTEIGGCRNLASPLTGTFCRLDSAGAEYYFGNWPSFSNEWGPDEEADEVYARKRELIRSKYPIIETYFEADHTWIERIIETLTKLHLADQHYAPGVIENSAIPASDRVVSLDDNQPEVAEIRAELEVFERELRESNEAGEFLGEEREVALAEVSTLRSILSRARVRAASTLAYAHRTLGWIAEKTATAAIGEGAKRLLNLIIGLFS